MAKIITRKEALNELTAKYSKIVSEAVNENGVADWKKLAQIKEEFAKEYNKIIRKRVCKRASK